MLTKIWSSGASPAAFVEIDVPDTVAAAIKRFIEANRDGDMFSAQDVADIRGTDDLLERADTDTASLLAAFCDGAWGVAQHGHDDFAIEQG